MTVVACLEAAALVLVVWLLLRHHSLLEQAWTQERRELLTRIQRPDIVPREQAVMFEQPDGERDEIDKVGEIMLDPTALEELAVE